MKLGLVAGELQDPVRNVPRVLNGAMALVVSLFILTNAAYFIALPLDQLGKTNTIALVCALRPRSWLSLDLMAQEAANIRRTLDAQYLVPQAQYFTHGLSAYPASEL
jgi:amino acid transporter